MSSGEPGRTWAATSAMWTQTRQPFPSRWAEIGVVEVARGGRVDGEGGELGEVAAGDVAGLGLLGGARGFLLDQAGEAAEAESLGEQVGDRVAGVGGTLAAGRLPPRAPEPRPPSRDPERRPPPPEPLPLRGAAPARRPLPLPRSRRGLNR